MDAPRVRTLDVVFAAVVSAVLVVATARVGAEPGNRSFDALAAVLVVVTGGVLALHRRAPMVALTVITAALGFYNLLGYSGGPVYLTWIVAIFAVSVAWGPGKAWVPTAVSTAVILFTGFHDSRELPIGNRLGQPSGLIATLFVSWAVGALLLGGSVRGRRVERAAMEERARHLAESREEEARRRVAEERVRIARDLHDSIAHGLASLSVQAGVGAHVLDERPEDARDALLAIKRASGEALSDLRSTLHMLRSGTTVPREPIAGLDRLPSLVDSCRGAGLAVDVVIEGDARQLPSAVDTAAFRIVQESLTNVIRHAGATRATVAVRHEDDRVEIEVTDDGRGAVASNGSGASADGASANGGGGGHGLAGMRERVAILGGGFHAGTCGTGGFCVRARLPL